MRDAKDVRIDNDAFGFAEADAEDNIGCFAGCAGNGDELGECLRDFAAEPFDNGLGGALDGFGLVVEEAGGADQLDQFRQ